MEETGGITGTVMSGRYCLKTYVRVHKSTAGAHRGRKSKQSAPGVGRLVW